MPAAPASPPIGLVLAAGAGRRFGGPKALARDADGTAWIVKAVRALRSGGCDPVLVALGAAGEEAGALAPPEARVLQVEGWSEGVAASLRAGLTAAASTPAPAVVVVPVDTPGLDPAAVARLIAGADAGTLAYATYRGSPGHPAVIGRAHWAAVISEVRGDAGARSYLDAHAATAIECGDLWSGADRDER